MGRDSPGARRGQSIEEEVNYFKQSVGSSHSFFKLTFLDERDLTCYYRVFDVQKAVPTLEL